MRPPVLFLITWSNSAHNLGRARLGQEDVFGSPLLNAQPLAVVLAALCRLLNASLGSAMCQRRRRLLKARQANWEDEASFGTTAAAEDGTID